MTAFTIVAGIVSILSFVYAFWTRFKGDALAKDLRTERDGLENDLINVHDLAIKAIWNVESHSPDDPAWTREAERALGLVAAIQSVTSKYAHTSAEPTEDLLLYLAGRNVLFTIRKMWAIEREHDISDTWVVSRDLEPDASDQEAGRTVGRNIEGGMHYCFFVPHDLDRLEELKSRLQANLGLSSGIGEALTRGLPAKARKRPGDRVNVVTVPRQDKRGLFERGNIVLYFRGGWKVGKPVAYEEVLFRSMPGRHLLWEEYDAAASRELYVFLRTKLEGTTPAFIRPPPTSHQSSAEENTPT